GQMLLLVEDEETLRLALSLSLKKNGFRVLATGNGRTALDLFRERAREVEAIVLDLTLPGMSGLEVLQELRRIRPDIKIVLTSAYDCETVNNRFGWTERESCTFVKKPYRIGELLNALRGLDKQTEARVKSAAAEA